MPFRPHDAASSRVSPISPAFVAAYAAKCGPCTDDCIPAMDAILMMRPHRRFSMSRPAAWEKRNAPVRLTSTTFCHFSSGMSSGSAAHVTPQEPNGAPAFQPSDLALLTTQEPIGARGFQASDLALLTTQEPIGARAFQPSDLALLTTQEPIGARAFQPSDLALLTTQEPIGARAFQPSDLALG